MLQGDPLTLLLVNEQAEEIKSATLCMRGSYPGCRVEAVYSAEEALEWASKQHWHVILLDERLPHCSALEILPELRRRAPNSAIIVLAEQHNTAIAMRVMRSGADYYLFKQSPAFLTELPIIAKELLEKRELRTQLDQARERYSRLTEHLAEMVYELDAKGQFLSVSQAVTPLLGYAPQELIGTHFSNLIHPEQRQLAERRFNERRTGMRATRNLILRLIAKSGDVKQIEVIDIEIGASGLYNRQRQFLGTIGIVRAVIERPQDRGRLPRSDEHRHHTSEPAADAQSAPPPAPEEQNAATAGSVSRDTSPHRQPDTTLLAQSRQGLSYPERRRSPRIDLELEARLKLNGTAWGGMARNVSLGGVYIVFNGPVPVTEGQPVQMGLVSEAGILEIQGTVRGVRETTGPQNGRYDNPAQGLAVEFTKLGTTEKEILASLLNGLRERSVSVKLTALLGPQETGNLLLEVRESDTLQHSAVHPVPVEDTAPSIRERRLATRVNLAVPIRVEPLDAPSKTVQQRGVLTNLSGQGACLRLLAQPNCFGQRLLLRVSPPQVPATPPANPPARAPECLLMGEIVWTAPDTTAPAAARGSSSEIPLRVGLRFLHLRDEEQRTIMELMERFLTSPDRVEEWAAGTKLVSELVECRNERGQRIAVYHDHPREPLPPGSPIVILSPSYGETKKEYISLAYFLASNGFHVLRYDHTNHVGESDGDIKDSTLTGMMQDLNSILNYAERMWPASPAAIVASRLAGRVALKAATKDARVKLLILLASVIDVQATLLAVHQEDLIGTYVRGARRGVINMLGFNIDSDNWLGDATKEGYADLRTTLQDAEHIQTPVILFTAEHDAWVSVESVKQVQAALREYAIHWFLIPEALHRLHENPRKARAVFRHLVACCLERFYPMSSPASIQEPSQRESGLQNRLEREHARARHQMAKNETFEFWQDYLEHFHYIANVSDFWHLLDHVYRMLGTLDGKQRILDAGCGNGNFGMFLTINRAYRERHSTSVESLPLHYVGVDFVPSALTQAKLNLINVDAEVSGRISGTGAALSRMITSFSRLDLNMPLPFRDNQFDRIVCNLVIGYLQDPLFTLRELVRVLAPNGRLVVTNLKPHADLSQIYRNFIQMTERPEEVEEGRRLLSNSGKIKQGESDGVFRFFDKQELAMLLIAGGAKQPRMYSTFANQAFIAVAEKPGTQMVSPYTTIDRGQRAD